MMKFIVLTEHTSIRKEWFGCLCYNLSTDEYFQYNNDAFEILCELINYISFDDLIGKLKNKGLGINREILNEFLKKLEKVKIVSFSEEIPVIYRKANIYYQNKQHFLKNCLVAPSSCTIYITELCNKSCKHCVVNASSGVDCSSELGIEEWKVILQKLKEFGVFALVFTGGEPLLKKDIFKILSFADSLGFKLSLLTDYDDLNQDHINRLIKLNSLNYIQVSLDGASETTHDFLRGKGSFKKAIKRLELLKKNAIEYTISTAVNKLNINEINQIAEIYRQYKAKYLYLNPLAPYGRAKTTLNNILLSDEELKYLAIEYYRLISKEGINSGNSYWQSLTSIDVSSKLFHPFKNILSAMSMGTYVFSISSKGECYLDSKMKSEGLMRLGNVLTDDLESLWYNPILEPLREFYFTGDPFIDHKEVEAISRYVSC